MKKLIAILAAALLSGCMSTVARVEGCWGAKALILGALVAMGVNIANGVVRSLFTGGV